MRVPDLDLDLLRGFVTVAERGGFTAAGSALGLTQSAISLKVKRLEDLLGKLDRRTASIIKMRYGIEDGRERTLTEVGKQHGLTRERIRQIEKHALLELKRMARDTGFDAVA